MIISPRNRRVSRPEASRTERGVRFGGETLTFIPADTVVKPLRDMLLVQAKDVVHSAVIYLAEQTKPLKGIVLAAGPGKYPLCYDHPEKHKRTKMWTSKRFQPTEVKVGDEIEVGGAEIRGYAFETCMYGDKFCFWCTEGDVAGIVTAEPLDQRTADRSASIQRRHLQSRAVG